MSNSEPPESPPPRRPFQFGLGTLLLITTLFAVLAAAFAGMLHRRAGRSSMPPGFFVLMAVAAPVAVLIVLSLVRAIVRWLQGRR